MDEDISIIDANTRNEKVKNFFINNKKKLIIGTLILFILIIGFLSLDSIQKKNKINLANKFNLSIINFKIEDTQKIIEDLIDIVKENDITYSPLALYFLIDNNLIKNTDEINALFDELINQTNLEEEIKNLNIYKKGLFNSNIASENELLQILNPIINSESIWKSHSLYLIAEYFYAKGEKEKAKEFFNQISLLPNANSDIKLASQKRLNRDLSE
jgi:predicted negative regulator of RcsB-dependent stress response|tara:strand:+ start:54 stop:698 length:645 start_codon:yes stop_codon:yes gene_type:complete